LQDKGKENAVGGLLTVMKVDFKDAGPHSDVPNGVYQHPVSSSFEHAHEFAGLGNRIPDTAPTNSLWFTVFCMFEASQGCNQEWYSFLFTDVLARGQTAFMEALIILGEGQTSVNLMSEK